MTEVSDAAVALAHSQGRESPHLDQPTEKISTQGEKFQGGRAKTQKNAIAARETRALARRRRRKPAIGVRAEEGGETDRMRLLVAQCKLAVTMPRYVPLLPAGHMLHL